MGRIPITVLLIMFMTAACSCSPIRSAATDPSTLEILPAVNMAPAYPQAAMEQGLDGSVRVRIDVDRQGRATRVEVMESSDPVFEQPSMDAAWLFQFKPLPPGAPDVPRFCIHDFRYRIARAPGS